MVETVAQHGVEILELTPVFFVLLVFASGELYIPSDTAVDLGALSLIK